MTPYSSPDQSRVYRFDEHSRLFDYLSGFDLSDLDDIDLPPPDEDRV